MPDGTFPNINLVEGVLNCIDSLQISPDDLEETNLEEIVQYYAKGITKMPTVKRLAKQILDKWNRMIFKIRVSYDPEGNYDQGYQEFSKKIQEMKGGQVQSKKEQLDNDEGDEEEDEFDDNYHGRKRQPQVNEGNQIMRGRVGIIMPDKNAFDFTARPREGNDAKAEKKKDVESGKAKL